MTYLCWLVASLISTYFSLSASMPMDSKRSAKRARDESDAPPASITRSRIWYFDGSVVLQAETTQFRVHVSILSAGSTVFKDMFEVARAPSNLESEVEGCPLVQLYDDKALDVELVLDAVYDRNFYQQRDKSFAQVSAMWRLGKKYGFDELRDDALRRLEGHFPSTLVGLQARQWGPLQAPAESLISPYPGRTIDSINLARETGLVSILPAALYMVCTQNANQRDNHELIMSGLLGADNRLVYLSDADKKLCLLVMSDLVEKQWKGPYSWTKDVGARCTYCKATNQVVKQTLGFPIPNIYALSPSMVGKAQLCAHCAASCQTVFSDGQKALWDELPGLFGLPSWPDIKKEMARIISAST
ncbi:hypothetical protein B0H11DRAFT_1810339 [Mycena galericulata]|nr:hypothetical protein B0H11DRAFT_1810339 [Mycena galericulata]